MDDDEPVELEPRYLYRFNWNALIGLVAFVGLLIVISQVAGPDAAGWTLVIGLIALVIAVIRRSRHLGDGTWAEYGFGGADDGTYDWQVGGELGDWGGGDSGGGDGG